MERWALLLGTFDQLLIDLEALKYDDDIKFNWNLLIFLPNTIE